MGCANVRLMWALNVLCRKSSDRLESRRSSKLLSCVLTASGHSAAVLSIEATNSLLFSGSQGTVTYTYTRVYMHMYRVVALCHMYTCMCMEMVYCVCMHDIAHVHVFGTAQ